MLLSQILFSASIDLMLLYLVYIIIVISQLYKSKAAWVWEWPEILYPIVSGISISLLLASLVARHMGH